MAKGGARTRSGPPPDPNADDWLTLPTAGRKSAAPLWPLPMSNKRERELWAQLWSKPQAVAWEQLGLDLQVALYVRRFTEAEQRNTPANLSTLVRQMADSLGLTVPGLGSNRWRIETKAPTKRSQQRAPSSKGRFAVIQGDGG